MGTEGAKIPVKVSVQSEDFSLADEQSLISAERTDIGAIVSFTGLCRDEGGQLEALELEHYPGMAEGEIAKIVDQALTRWPLQALTVIHRYGKIPPGEQIVLVMTASAHRREAFEAADFLMDYLKNNAPFWKKQHFNSNTPASWVEAKKSDQDAADRWS